MPEEKRLMDRRWRDDERGDDSRLGRRGNGERRRVRGRDEEEGRRSRRRREEEEEEEDDRSHRSDDDRVRSRRREEGDTKRHRNGRREEEEEEYRGSRKGRRGEEEDDRDSRRGRRGGEDDRDYRKNGRREEEDDRSSRKGRRGGEEDDRSDKKNGRRGEEDDDRSYRKEEEDDRDYRSDRKNGKRGEEEDDRSYRKGRKGEDEDDYRNDKKREEEDKKSYRKGRRGEDDEGEDERSHRREKKDKRRGREGSEEEGAQSTKAMFDLFERGDTSNRIDELEAERKKLEAECQELEWTLKARVRKARRKPDETYVWVLIEYDNYGCERYVNGYGVLPSDWKILLFRNKNAVGYTYPVVGSEEIKSQNGGKAKSVKDEKSSLTYPTADLCFTAGEIARRAKDLGIERETTIYFIFSPLIENSRYHQLMVLLDQLGIRSFSFDGKGGSLDSVMEREGVDVSIFKTAQHHRAPRAQSRGPKGRSHSAGLR